MKSAWKALAEIDTTRPPSWLRPAPKVSGTYATTPYTVRVDDLEYEDELTPVKLACLVCKGRIFHSKEDGTNYSKARCKWCTEGAMNGEQINNYLNRDKIVDAMLRRYVEE